MRPANLNSRRTSALPTSRKESALSSHMSVSWLNERNAHQGTACSRAARLIQEREGLSKYAVRNTQGQECFSRTEHKTEPIPGILIAGKVSCLSPVQCELRRLGKKITTARPETFASTADSRTTRRDAELEELGSKYSVLRTGCGVPRTRECRQLAR